MKRTGLTKADVPELTWAAESEPVTIAQRYGLSVRDAKWVKSRSKKLLKSRGILE